MADDDLLDFLPLFPDEDESTILQRLRDDANEGLDPATDVEQWVDTREGSHWQTVNMPVVREFARLWDAIGTEVVAATLPAFAWDTYLDDHAELWGLSRLPGTRARGEVTFTGPEGTTIPQGFTLTVEPTSMDAEVPEFMVTEAGTLEKEDPEDEVATATLPVVATEVGEIGNVPAGAVVVFSTPPPAPRMTVTNAEPIVGGTEPETDEALRARIVQALAGRGPGTVADYRRWAGSWPGVGRVAVVPLWDGPGTVLVIVSDARGRRLPQDVVDALRAALDPVPGKGEGLAPIGAHVTVMTTDSLNVDVAGTVTMEPGFSLDGEPGTVAVRDAVTEAVASYVESVRPGDTIVLAQVMARIAMTQGVRDVTGVTLNGDARNLPVPSSPPQAPVLLTPLRLVEA